jgi:hypothetical protein
MTTPVVRQAILTAQQFDQLLTQFPEAEDMLRARAVPADDGGYVIPLSDLSDADRQALGPEVVRALESYVVEPDISREYSTFTDAIHLVGITINLHVEHSLEAFLAIRNSDEANAPPTILRAQEGDRVQRGATNAEDIFLDEIQDGQQSVILRQGDAYQLLTLPPPFTQAQLAGILDVGQRRQAVFSDRQIPLSRRPRQQRLFAEGDEIESGVVVEQIAEQWVLLKNEQQQRQLVLLRDSLNREVTTALPPRSVSDDQLSAFSASPSENLQEATPVDEPLDEELSDSLKAVNAFSKAFLATPLF